MKKCLFQCVSMCSSGQITGEKRRVQAEKRDQERRIEREKYIERMSEKGEYFLFQCLPITGRKGIEHAEKKSDR